MSVGLNIKKRRFELGLSQNELAEKMGYKTRSTIAKIESEENDISYMTMLKFCEVLDIPIEQLILGSNIHSSQNNPSNIIKEHKNIAIILAGGKSTRNQQNIPNQFINILGKPVIVHILETYQNHTMIDDIYVVSLKGWENIISSYANQYGITKLRKVITGESTGVLSARAGYYSLNEHNEKNIIIFQESTRPLVSTETISSLISETEKNNHAVICHYMKDHVLFTQTQYNTKYIDRNELLELQSPDAYKDAFIGKMFKKSDDLNMKYNESCVPLLLDNLGHKLNFIEGNDNNIKIIRQTDIAIAKVLIQSKN